MSVNSLISPHKEIYYLHYNCNGQSVYLKVHSGQERVTLVSVSGKKGKSGRYCRGIYELKWISFLGHYGCYDKYWQRHHHMHKAKAVCTGERIAHFLKITTENQYEQAKKDVLNSFI